MPLTTYLLRLIIISSLLFSGIIVSAQSSTDAFMFAKKWYSEGNYEKAILETRRAIFFNDSLKIPGYLMLTDCYLQSGAYDKAINSLTLVAGMEQDDSIQNEILFRMIHVHLQNKKPEYALIRLSELDNINSAYFDRKKNFYSAFAYFQIDDFSRSEIYLYKVLGNSAGFDSGYLSNIYTRAEKNSNRSTVLPQISSAILPGSGQLIEGYYKESANAFLLNSAMTVVTVYAFYRLYPLDAVLTMYPFVRRYYLSNIFNTGDLTVSKQERVKTEIYNELLEYTNSLINQ